MSLAHKVSTNVAARIWAASYDPKRDTFRVSLENGKIFLLQRPIIERLAESLQVKTSDLIVNKNI